MMQLWINGRRIDSITVLREMFSSEDIIIQHRLCAELISKVAAGIFIPWLERCYEARLRNSQQERAQDESQGVLDLEQCYRDLKKESDLTSLSNESVAALAKICNIDAISFQTATTQQPSIPDSDKLFELLEKQDWYQRDAKVKKSIKAISPGLIAIDSDSLARVVTTVGRQHSCDPIDIYLLSVGKPFVVRNINALRNLRLVGYGCPLLTFPPQCRGMELDMEERKLNFERLRLNGQGLVLIGKEECCKEVSYL